jgi:NAD-dependent deacetylase
VANAIATLAERIRSAERLTILTGAGVSAASGVPTFRGPDGLWGRHRPEELATPEAFIRDPDLVWEWYAWRRTRIAACRPNAAHAVIARWSHGATARGDLSPESDRGTGRLDVVVVTQNVDDLHSRAGTRGLVRMHGSIWELSCWNRCVGEATVWRDERVPFPTMPPRCPHCGGLARPGVVWFGESLQRDDIAAAVASTACDVFLAIGTSSVVLPAAGLVQQARSRGAFTAEINTVATTASSNVHVAIQAPAELVLPALDKLLRTN